MNPRKNLNKYNILIFIMYVNIHYNIIISKNKKSVEIVITPGSIRQ